MSVLQAAVRRKLQAPSNADAARLLTQATWGYSFANLTAITGGGSRNALEVWIDDQLTASTFNWAAAQTTFETALDPDFALSDMVAYLMTQRAYTAAANDRLRCRAAFAIQKFFPINLTALDISFANSAVGFVSQIEPFVFGTFRQLLEAVTKTPQMAKWLTFIGSGKATATSQPDENYAREVMQLFTIGLLELHPNGTRKKSGELDPSDPRYVALGQDDVPTYTLADVRGLSRVFTGYGAAGSTSTMNQSFGSDPPTWLTPIVNVAAFHETGTKVFLGVTIPINTTAAASLTIALDTLVNHPSCPPFVCKKLIQMFTTSNPSPEYVGRVSAAFINDGLGVRGNLRAVFKAILMDQEARSARVSALPTWGKVKENYIVSMQAAIPFAPARVDANAGIVFREAVRNAWPGAFAYRLTEPPSVFGYVSPNYSPSQAFTALGMVAPELQIYGESSVSAATNYMIEQYGQGLMANAGGPATITLNLAELVALATPAPMVDRLSLLLCAGQLSAAAKAAIVTRMGTGQTAAEWALRAVRWTVSHPEFWVQK